MNDIWNYSDESPIRILVIDDEARIREACRMVLQDCGYEVTLASDGNQGLDRIQESFFDIVLLDLMMPELSGLDVLARIHECYPDTVVIVITGYATVEHSVDAMKKGAFDFIPKPFSPEQLRVTVSKAIDFNRALKDISETRSRLRTLVNRLSEGVMCINRQNRIVLANPTFLRMAASKTVSPWGLDYREVIGFEPLKDLVFQGTRGFQAEEGASFEETVHELVQGFDEAPEQTVMLVRIIPFRNRPGRLVGSIVVVNDITTLKHMDRMKSEFVSMVSHELRSPMNSVLMQLQVILEGLAGDLTPKQREILERAYEKIGNLAQMTTELLDLATIESGLMISEKTAVDMAAVIRAQVEFHRPKAESEAICLLAEAPQSLPPIRANRRNMEEVLSNLITNAIKYSPNGGVVTVSADLSGDYLAIRVKDTGLGMSEEDTKKIFQRFYRIRNEATRSIQGTGLGLAIVQKIVESHNGRISVESAPGKGSTFTVLLPLERE
uniref:histidine kinase n=1 Tax=Desulfatirhabdium butyrativorans TaxID=340467 RepID=A0A7C4RSS7_9BACT